MVGELYVMKKNLLEELIVVKRSGQRVGFNGTKIAIAIKRAFDSIGEDFNEKDINKVYENVLKYIEENYEGRKTINIEDIQDIIEDKLKQNGQLKVYQSFSEYRLKRAASRKAFGIKQEHKFVKVVEKIANINNNESNIKPLKALMDYGKTIASEFSKVYVLDNKYIRLHEEGNIYIQDLDYFALGFLQSVHLKYSNLNINNDYFFKLIKHLIDVKKEINGEISINRIDFVLVPFVLKRYQEVFKQNIINYLNLGGYENCLNYNKLEENINKINKIEFDINFYSQFILNNNMRNIFEKAHQSTMLFIKDELVTNLRNLLEILNQNQELNSKYNISLGTNNTYEGILITDSLLSIVEDLNYFENITVIVKIANKNNQGLIAKVSKLIAKNKNIALSFINSSYNKDKYYEIEYFGNGKRIFENINSDEKQSVGRMVIASTVINISRIGLKSKNLKNFYLELNETLELVKNELISVFEILGNKNKDNYNLLFQNNILDDEKLEFNQKIRKVIKNGVLNIELAGLKEGTNSLEQDRLKQNKLLIDILKHINIKVNEFIAETKLNFVISESNDKTVLKELIALDKSIFGINKNVTEKDCYCCIGSMFDYKENILEDLRQMAIYQKYLTGGCLLEIGLTKNSTEKKIAELIENLYDCDIGFARFTIKNIGEKNDS